MININQVTLAYGAKELFRDITFTIKVDSKMGLVGKNGTGKSSLLKLIMGQHSPTSGTIEIPKGIKLGYLSQFLTLDESLTVVEGARSAFAEIMALDKRMDELNNELAHRDDYESDAYQKLIDNISLTAQQLDMFDASKIDARVEKVLKGLGFSEEQMNKQIAELSGGWKMRVELAKLLLEEPDYLFLDEPVNHLDIESILWLEKWLKNYPGAFVVIAHDQEFMDNCVTEIVEIENHGIQQYKTNYSNYIIEKELREEQLISSFKNQQKQIAQKERLVERFRAKASKASMAKSLQKELDRMDRIEYTERNSKSVKFHFLPAKRANQVVCKSSNIYKSYGDLDVLEGLDFEMERGQKIAFVGQNGQGKSTFAKILIGDIQPTKGHAELGSNIQLAYFRQDAADRLPADKTLLEFMEEAANDDMRPKVRSLLGSFLFSGDDVEKKISVLSGGEKNRLAFAHLLLEPFNFLLLDEPTHHLDIEAKDTLKRALQQFDGALLIISHDRSFLEGLTDEVVEFRDRKIKRYLGDIQYFMNEREAQSMRQIEKKAPPRNEAQSSHNETKNNVDQKRLRAIEKKIERLEEKISELELQMSASDFYEQEGAESVVSKHGDMKKELTALTDEWESMI